MSLRVYFDRDGYLPGTTVTAYVCVYLSEAKSVEYIYAEVQGIAKTCVYKHNGESSSYYYDKEVYMNFNVRVHTPPNGVMNPGQYNLPFSFQLPYMLPPNFEGLLL